MMRSKKCENCGTKTADLYVQATITDQEAQFSATYRTLCDGCFGRVMHGVRNAIMGRRLEAVDRKNGG